MKSANYTILARYAAAALLLSAAPALAHTGTGAAHGLISGFGHPLGGLDHLLAMVAVGLLAAALGGRALWALPAGFIAAMLAGAAAAIAGVELPAVEQGILASVIVLGALVAAGIRWPALMAVAVAGLFGLFHGHAHGAELPAGAAAWDYAIGFAAATLLLHLAGIGLGLLSRARPAVRRFAGLAIMLAGGMLAWGV